jgi:hypothetical protein
VWMQDESVQFSEVIFFKAKLKHEVATQTDILIQQSAIDHQQIDLQRIYQFALLAEKMISKQSVPIATTMPNTNRSSTTSCFYCGNGGHTIRECNQKKKYRQPCQKYIDSGRARFGPSYEWDPRKLKSKTSTDSKVHNMLVQQEDTVLTIQPKTESSRTVAMILTDVKSDEGHWFNDVPTLIDSCGCENGINTDFAMSNGFVIHKETIEHQLTAVTACGGRISFDKFVDIEIRLGSTYTTIKFYLMKDLPRTLLIGFPFFENSGAILDARAGTFFIADLKQTIPLLQMQKQTPTEMVIASFGIQHCAETTCEDINQKVILTTAPRHRNTELDEAIVDLQNHTYIDK